MLPLVFALASRGGVQARYRPNLPILLFFSSEAGNYPVPESSSAIQLLDTFFGQSYRPTEHTQSFLKFSFVQRIATDA